MFPRGPRGFAPRQREGQLSGNLGFGFDPNRAVMVDLPAVVHATELGFLPPKTGLPVGFIPIEAFDTTSGVALTIVGPPVLNRARTDGKLGITLQYASPLGIISREDSTNQSINNNSETALVFDTSLASVGSAISYSAGIFTLAIAGVYSCTSHISWNSNTYSDYRLFIRNAGSQIASNITSQAGLSGFFSNEASVTKLFAAGATIDCAAFQTNLSSAARTLLNTGGYNAKISIIAISPDPATTARVRGLLFY